MSAKKKLNYILIIILLIAVIFLILNGRKEEENVPKYVFTYAENHPEDYPTTLGAYKFAELVYERTDGEIQIVVQPNGVLGDEKRVIEQVRFGGIDFARVSLSPLADSYPQFNVLQLPYLYRDSEHMWKVLDGEIGEQVLHYFDDTGIVGLSWYDAGARNFYNNKKPIRTLDDIKGMKIRVQESEMMEDMIRAIGAEPVPLAYGDVYSELQTGKIDGAENNWPSYESSGHYKVAKYCTIDEHTRVPEIQMCSQATWDQLTKEEQQIIKECAEESALYERSIWLEREKQSVRKVTQGGVEVVTLSIEERERFQKAVQGIYEKYCADDKLLIQKIEAIE